MKGYDPSQEINTIAWGIVFLLMGALLRTVAGLTAEDTLRVLGCAALGAMMTSAYILWNHGG